MSWLIRKDQKGFTLIELLLALAILGVVTYFIVSLTSSVRQGGKAAETSQRIEIISAKMKEYYRAQGEMPEPAGDEDNEVPVNDLNLEAKYRFDGWGQVIYYHRGDEINGVEVDGVENMAGYLWSLGGDQEEDAQDNNDDLLEVDDLVDTANTAGDDILMAINVNREAMEIALDEVRELQRRVNQFDNLFEGGAGVSCQEAGNPGGHTLCSPGDTDWEFDTSNCGTGSLDQIEADNDSYGCDQPPREFIVEYYGLSDQYLEDPWDNPYQWGCGSICADTYHTFDPRYRKFFSMGPDGDVDDGPDGGDYGSYSSRSDIDIEDDIIP